MSRLRIEALLTAVLAACGGATEASSGGSADGTSSSSPSSSSSSGSTGATSTSGGTGTGIRPCDSTKPPYTETKSYDLAQACADYQARFAPTTDAGTDGDVDGGTFDCASVSCSSLCEAAVDAYSGSVWVGPSDCKRTATELSCTIHRPCGRRFAGMEEPTTNDVLAGAAYLEAASVIAFEHLAHDLAFHEAPFRLIAAAVRAGEDERRHTALVHALAGGEWPEPNAKPWRARSLVDIAIENAVEGCVGETWGALVALAQARDAEAPEIRAAYARIAPDEIDHAALAHDIDAWIRPLLTPAERAAVDAARTAAWARFTIDIDATAARELGIPNGDTSRRMLEALASAA